MKKLERTWKVENVKKYRVGDAVVTSRRRPPDFEVEDWCSMDIGESHKEKLTGLEQSCPPLRDSEHRTVSMFFSNTNGTRDLHALRMIVLLLFHVLVFAT